MESFKIRIEDDSGQKVFHPETEKDCVVGLQEDLTNINGEIDKLKTGGYADNLPIGSVIHVEQDSEIPAGYEEVLDDNYHVPANFVGSNEDNKLLDAKLTEIDNEIERINTQGVAVGDTLPIGGTFYFEGTEAELPTGFEKVDVVPSRQLLVNNDFQINQRGQSEYNTKTNEYTLDMWASVGVSKIRINPNKKVGGIYTNGSILQFVNENLDNQNVTLSMKIDGIVITKTFKCTVGYSDIVVYQGSKFQVSVSNNVLVDRGLTKFEFYLLNLQGEVLIEYVDLFEGDVAYPHVKKKYSEDLAECQQYYASGYDVMQIAGCYKMWEVSRNSVLGVDFILPNSMKSSPIVNVKLTRIYCNDLEESFNFDELEIETVIRKRLLTVQITRKDKGIFTGANYATVGMSAILSCEPL